MALAIMPLGPRHHDRAGFHSGVEAFDVYLRSLATQHRRKGYSQTFVLVEESAPARIFGYYCLSAASLQIEALSETDRKRLPRYPVPAARMGQLAVDMSERGRGYGELLLQNAIKRCLAVRERELGIYALLVDAYDEGAATFYEHYGFRRCRDKVLGLYLPLGSP